MRPRTKMSGLVSHTRPNGKSIVSHRERCSNSLRRLERLLDEGYEIIGAKRKRTGTPKRVKVSLFGGDITVIVEYQDWINNGSIGKIIQEL